MSAAEANAGNAALLQRLRNLKHGDQQAEKIQLEIANGLWVAHGFPIKASFISTNQESFQAQVSDADFNDPATVRQINAWVSEHTHGTIPHIAESPLDPLARLIVLDAIYFKSDWMFQFDPKATRDMPFRLADGRRTTRARMRQSGQFRYYENGQVQAIALPYSYAVQMYVEVNEKGTEASAATEMIISQGIHDPSKDPPPFTMMVDIPFSSPSATTKRGPSCSWGQSWTQAIRARDSIKDCEKSPR